MELERTLAKLHEPVSAVLRESFRDKLTALRDPRNTEEIDAAQKMLEGDVHLSVLLAIAYMINGSALLLRRPGVDVDLDAFERQLMDEITVSPESSPNI